VTAVEAIGSMAQALMSQDPRCPQCLAPCSRVDLEQLGTCEPCWLESAEPPRAQTEGRR
jgi:hypothetical protein